MSAWCPTVEGRRVSPEVYAAFLRVFGGRKVIYVNGVREVLALPSGRRLFGAAISDYYFERYLASEGEGEVRAWLERWGVA